MNEKRILLVGLVVLLAVSVTTTLTFAQGPAPRAPRTLMGTWFTYQGQLKSGGTVVNGDCDFAFRLYDGSGAPAMIGSAITTTLQVSNGLFTTALDFGANAFNGDARLLDIQVRCPSGSGAYTALTTRQALTPAPYALALPGLYTQQHATSPNLIGGYSGNWVAPGVYGATIGGGGANGYINQAGANYATIGGGFNNTASGLQSPTVGGGFTNVASGVNSTVGGGSGNNAAGPYSTVAGGSSNSGSQDYATVAGGFNNTASGQYATVPGGLANQAKGDYSFAAGRRAIANLAGTFVWADSLNKDFNAGGIADSFNLRARGGVYIVTGCSGNCTPLDYTSGVQLAGGGSAWAALSDRNLKANFARVDSRAVLERVAAMPIETWNYQAQEPSIRHIGPMAQDFYAAFNIGEDDKHITTIDADGVALAAIQGLYQENRELKAQVTILKQQNAALETRVAALEQSTVAAKSPSNDHASSGWMLGAVLVAAVLVSTRRWGGTR